MNAGLKLAANLVPFSRMCDRFVPEGYTQGFPLEKQVEMLAAVEGIDGADIGWPCGLPDGAALKRLLMDHGLVWAISDADIYTERRFKNGSFSNPDPKIRNQALDRVKESIDNCVAGGTQLMNLWLGQDGFEYCFQGHYQDAWQWIEEGICAVAEYNSSDMPICIEPKCKEPRGQMYLANVSKVLMLLNKINDPGLGLTLDFGHSLAALEQPAEVAVLSMREGWLKQIHLNDNRRDWDLDLVPGSTTVWEHIEFYYWLLKMGYTGWMGADVFPYREDGTEALERVVQVHRKCCDLASRLVEMNIEPLLRQGKHLEILAILWDMFRD